MAEPMLAPAAPRPADRELFSLHPEEQMTERPSHRLQGTYLEQALPRVLPGWYVAANMAVYWVPGEMEYPYVGPDVLVARNTPQREDPSVYLTYEDGPLTLVVEVASPRTRYLDRHKRDTIYAIDLVVPWYLWIDLPRHVLELYQLVNGRYELVPPDEHGRVWCPALGVGFVWQPDGRLVRVLTADQIVAPTAEEIDALRREERALRKEAEERAVRAARRAEDEAAARRAAEQRAEALAAELERLRQALHEARRAEDSEDEP